MITTTICAEIKGGKEVEKKEERLDFNSALLATRPHYSADFSNCYWN